MKEGPSSAVETSEASQNLIMRRTVMAVVTDISSCPLLSDTYILETSDFVCGGRQDSKGWRVFRRFLCNFS